MVSSILTTRVQMATLRFHFANISVVDVSILSQHLSRQFIFGCFLFSSVQSATDASIVDGMSVSRGSNLIGDVVQGLTMELLAPSSAAATVNITRDSGSLKETIQDLATAYNETVSDFGI